MCPVSNCTPSAKPAAPRAGITNAGVLGQGPWGDDKEQRMCRRIVRAFLSLLAFFTEFYNMVHGQ